MANSTPRDDDEFEMQIIQHMHELETMEKAASQAIPRAKCSSTSSKPEDGKELQLPSDFRFPFTPYSIQSDFMVQLFRTIETGHVGIFESPTGTGKSLSLICGSLTWLRLNEERMRAKFDSLTISENAGADDDWISAFAEKEENLRINHEFIEQYRQLQQRENDLLQWKKAAKIPTMSSKFHKRKMTTFGNDSEKHDEIDEDELPVGSEEDSFLLDGYNSDGESIPQSSNESIGTTIDVPKIIYCSRTHSQLAQFLNELKRTSFAKDIRCVTLGSRQTFCVNESVLKCKHLNLINDRCLQLQKDKAEKASSKKGKLESDQVQRSKKGCPYYKQMAVEELSNSILLNGVRDVENVVSEGRSSKACPYYAVRRAVASAHLVLAPYHVLLHKATRSACGLKVKGNVVIVDEAHNLLDTIASIHSNETDITHLESAYLQIQRYLQRFSTRLNAKNLMYVRQFAILLDRLISCVKSAAGGTVMSLTDFTFHAKIEDINLFKLLRFIEVCHVSEKLNGYANKHLQNSTVVQNGCGDSARMSSPFHTVEAFLRCLVQRSEDGRVLLIPRLQDSLNRKQGKLKFIHLNPSLHFKEICMEARSVILAGGTMEPVTDLIEQLFLPCGKSAGDIDRFSCGHIVDDKNLLPLILEKGPSGVTFDFSFANRQSEDLIKDLGRLLANLVNVVPGGIVCFFQSYEYEATVYDRLSKLGILQTIEKKKKIFREPTKSQDIGGILDGFSKHANTGAMMLAVVGGKLSEGINFANNLGRLVVMVGLPFPNSNSLELKEKMRVLNSKCGDSRRGQEYYENLCMRAVNQSIGRVIRHRDDYAAIVLLDKGYCKPTVHKKLPSWINQLIKYSDTFGACFGLIKQFFVDLQLKYSST